MALSQWLSAASLLYPLLLIFAHLSQMLLGSGAASSRLLHRTSRNGLGQFLRPHRPSTCNLVPVKMLGALLGAHSNP